MHKQAVVKLLKMSFHTKYSKYSDEDIGKNIKQ